MIKNNNKIYKRQRAQPNEMQLECQRWSQQLAAAEAAVREVGLECIESSVQAVAIFCELSLPSTLCCGACFVVGLRRATDTKLYFLHSRVQAPAGSQNLHTPVNIEDVFHIHSNMMAASSVWLKN